MEERKDWNPDLYLKFKNERTQPSIDLVSRIDLKNPKTIIDVGCGPGNSTQVLVNRWPESRISGIDNSPAMIEKAAHDYPAQKWAVMDAREIKGQYDLVFSSATIQWIPNHDKFLLKLLESVEENGALAVQIPSYFEMPVKKAVDSAAMKPHWKNSFSRLEDVITIHSAEFYYDILSSHVKALSMWKTSYIHVMDSHQAIIDMVKTTGMKPYLDHLNTEDEKKHFEVEVLGETKKAYGIRADGKVLFPFERLFFVAYR